MKMDGKKVHKINEILGLLIIQLNAHLLAILQIFAFKFQKNYNNNKSSRDKK